MFLNESSNCMHQKMYNHSGYICLTFLHWVFKNVSSNCLHFSVLFFFSLRVFKRVLKWPAWEDDLCIILGRPLVLFIWLFSTVHFQITPQIARNNLFFKILWLNTLAVSLAFTQCPYQSQTIHKKIIVGVGNPDIHHGDWIQAVHTNLIQSIF